MCMHYVCVIRKLLCTATATFVILVVLAAYSSSLKVLCHGSVREAINASVWNVIYIARAKTLRPRGIQTQYTVYNMA